MAVLKAEVAWRNKVEALEREVEILRVTYSVIEDRGRARIEEIENHVVNPMTKHGTNRTTLKNLLWDLREEMGQVSFKLELLQQELVKARGKGMDDDTAS